MTSSPTLESGSQARCTLSFHSHKQALQVDWRLFMRVCVCVSSRSPADRSRPCNNTSKKGVTLICVYDVTLTFHEQPDFSKPLNAAFHELTSAFLYVVGLVVKDTLPHCQSPQTCLMLELLLMPAWLHL